MKCQGLGETSPGKLWPFNIFADFGRSHWGEESIELPGMPNLIAGSTSSITGSSKVAKVFDVFRLHSIRITKADKSGISPRDWIPDAARCF